MKELDEIPADDYPSNKAISEIMKDQHTSGPLKIVKSNSDWASNLEVHERV